VVERTLTDARTEILERIRAAERAAAPVVRDYRQTGAASDEERVTRFCRRAGEYRAQVRRVPSGGVADAVTEVCRKLGASRIGIPKGLPAAWRPRGLKLVEDEGLAARELDNLDGVVTGCTVAVAETGTIALAGGPHEGRRALTLVPDLHVCVVEERQVVELVPEAVRVLSRIVAEQRRPVTLVSGPSATSDIELSRVEGVHGPCTLVVLVASDG
jgi:L-lactate dehydrogenase complex protein LldG